MGIELQNSVAHDLQRHAADLPRLGARRPLIDRSQGEKPPRLWPILCLFRYRAKTRRIKITPKPNRNRHGYLPPFATLNHISDALRIPKSHLLRELVLRATARQMLTRPGIGNAPVKSQEG